MSKSMANHTCESAGCSAQANLQCPTCIKLAIPGSYFCSQECFKGNWSIHKALHKIGLLVILYPGTIKNNCALGLCPNY